MSQAIDESQSSTQKELDEIKELLAHPNDSDEQKDLFGGFDSDEDMDDVETGGDEETPAAATAMDPPTATAMDTATATMEGAPTAMDTATAAATTMDPATAPAATAMDSATAAATTAVDPATAAATAMDTATGAATAMDTAMDTATAAPTAVDPTTAAAASEPTAAPTGAEQMEAPKATDQDEDDEDEDEELLKELEAALFSGSEDEGHDIFGATERPAATEKAAKTATATATATAATKDSKQQQQQQQQQYVQTERGLDFGGGGGAAGMEAQEPKTAKKGRKTKAEKQTQQDGGDVPPPPPPPELPKEGEEGFDETRFTKDQHGNMVHKWKVDYAARAGGGRAMCKDTDCLERHDQGGVKLIEKGCLRIGRRVLMKAHSGDEDGSLVTLWYHARCMFNVFLRSRKSTRVITSPADLEGFESIEAEDQEMLRRFIASNEEIRSWPSAASGAPRPARAAGAAPGKRPLETPEKTAGATRATPGGVGLLGESAAAKKRRLEGREVKLRKGDRVWTFCRVRPKVGADGRAPAEFSVRSAKPELGLIVEEEKEGYVVIQFEKAEDEAERLALYQNPRKRKIRGWLRYPRVFEGKKQRIQVNWIQFNRPPPKLCGCNRQEWGHDCPCSGISCGRGTSTKVWGVGQ